MRTRSFRPTVAIFSIFLLAGTPVHAGPIATSEVVQIIGVSENYPELRLRRFSQSSSTPVETANQSTQKSAGVKQTAGGSPSESSKATTAAAATNDSKESLLSGVTANADKPQTTVSLITEGDVEGTICDCGEIALPSGSFPKWPLLFLAGIPFLFIQNGDHSNTPTSPTPAPPVPPLAAPEASPSPSPSSPPIPEPASLLLFGTGLVGCCGWLRRRYARQKASVKAGIKRRTD